MTLYAEEQGSRGAGEKVSPPEADGASLPLCSPAPHLLCTGGAVGPCAVQWLGAVPYSDALDMQRALVQRVSGSGRATAYLMLLEHPPVVTVGRGAREDSLGPSSLELESRGIPVVPTDRGGQATYHGPGQLVGYPIFRLSDRGLGIRQYVRSLEDWVIETLAAFGLAADRQQGRVGVFVGQAKIASIGIRVERGVCFHGVAVNVSCDLEPFHWFSPCGIPGLAVTSMSKELGRLVSVEPVAREMAALFCGGFGWSMEPGAWQ